MGYEPSKTDPDVWIKHVDDHWEYIAIYVDDLAIISKDPKSIILVLTDPDRTNFKIKRDGPIKFHLGCNFFCNNNGVLCFAPHKYVDKMCSDYLHMFGKNLLQQCSSPWEKGDHPELDISNLLKEDSME